MNIPELGKQEQALIDTHNVGLIGVAPMFFVTFKKDGVRTHHSYICFRHTEEDLEKTAAAIDKALRYVKGNLITGAYD